MKQQGKIWIISSEEQAVYLAGGLLPHFEEVRVIQNPNLLPSLLRGRDLDAVMLDMNFSAGQRTGNEGLYWMRRIREYQADINLVCIIDEGNVSQAVSALKEGALDVYEMPVTTEQVLERLKNLVRKRHKIADTSDARTTAASGWDALFQPTSFISGPSPKMRDLLRLVNRVAPTDANILILGESGTGKGLIAQEIHRKSTRNHATFVHVDMGAIVSSLMESELFGHMKGAFTDAREDRPGRFVQASGGTLFLDEIGNLPLEMQSKLLGALQSREVMPLGATQSRPFNVRLISASNTSLEEKVQAGLFREDLLYRINTIQLTIPPLRERKEDIIPLAIHFLAQFTDRYSLEEKRLHPRAVRRLLEYDWPGNIRELEHYIEKAVILSEKNQVTMDDIPLDKSAEVVQAWEGSYNLMENERRLIRAALRKNRGNMTATATALGISRKTLYNKMEKYRI